MVDDLWPPAPFDVAAAEYRKLDAWLRTDVDTLAGIYGTVRTADGKAVSALKRTWRRMFHGRPVDEKQHQSRMTVSTAAEVTSTLADLLVTEKPRIRFRRPDNFEPKMVDGKPERWEHPAQARLDELIGSDEAHAQMLIQTEYSAGLGDGYLAVVWDADAEEKKPRIKAFAADAAVPDFVGDQLVAVTLWTQFERGSDVYRLLERHALGTISYTLHKGGVRNLGEAVPLAMIPDTVHYELLRSEADYTIAMETGTDLPLTVTIATGVPDMLTVVRIPYAMPNREWRKMGALANLGRSALAGQDDIIDKIDRVNSSLARDFDNGQGRIVVPQGAVESGAPGEGGSFDLDKQVLLEVSGLGSADSVASVQVIQPNIRVDVHEQGVDFWKRQLASAIGISPTHLGIKESSSGTRTATEVSADLTDSERTRDKMALYARPAYAKLSKVLLAVDAVQFPNEGGMRVEELPEVEFAPVSQPDEEKQARVAQLGWSSQSMDVEDRIRYLHRDWDDDEVAAAATRIRTEFGIPTEGAAPEPDPTAVTTTGPAEIVEP